MDERGAPGRPEGDAEWLEGLFDRGVLAGLRGERALGRLRHARRAAGDARAGAGVRAELRRLAGADPDADVRAAAGDALAVLAADAPPIGARLADAWSAHAAARAGALLGALRERFRVLEPQPGQGGGEDGWEFFQPGEREDDVIARIRARPGGGSEVTVAGLPAEVEGELLTLLAPALLEAGRERPGAGGGCGADDAGGADGGSGRAGARSSAGWFEAGAPVREGRATFDVGALPADARALGAIWIDQLDLRLAARLGTPAVAAPPPGAPSAPRRLAPRRELPGVRRRLLVAVGCGEHAGDQEHHSRLIAVPETLARVEALFCGDGSSPGLGYERVSAGELGIPENPTEPQLEDGLDRWFADADLGPADVVAVWFVGHGVVDPGSGALRLVCHDSGPRGGVEAGRLGELAARAGLVWALLVADCCRSGEFSQDAAERTMKAAADAMAARARPPQDEDQPRNARMVFVAAGRKPEESAQGDLVRALEHALLERRLGGFAPAPLDPDRVVEVANEALKHGVAQVAKGAGPGGIPPIFPNPHHGKVPAAAGAEVGHFDPSARGVSGGTADQVARAWRFQGRYGALRAVNGWLGDPAAGAVCAITGRPGSGKSAVLGRTVTLSAPDYRAEAERECALEDAPEGTVPPERAVACAVWARQKGVGELLAEIHAGLFGEPPPGTDPRDALATALRELPVPAGPPLIAVDALDEADEPEAIAAELADLAADGRVRLLVGTRRFPRPKPGAPLIAPGAGEAVAGEGAAGEDEGAAGEGEGGPGAEAEGRLPAALAALGPLVVDLDHEDYFDRADMVAYARVTLAEVDPAYARDEGLATEIAGRIAERAGQSFLFARIVAGAVARSGASDPRAISIPAKLDKAIDADLARRLARDPDNPTDRRAALQLSRDLMRPLAHARGDGLPLERVWAAAATALAGAGIAAGGPGRPGAGGYLDSDVEERLDVLLPYLAETATGAMGPCYRLDHDLVVHHYRDAPGGDEAAEEAIVDVLERLSTQDGADTPDWLREPARAPLRYSRRHLAGHAAGCGRLDGLLGDAAFLLAADQDPLLAELSRAVGDAGRPAPLPEAGHVYRAVAHRLRGRPAGEAAAQLELAARRAGAGPIADAVGALGLQPFRVRWATGRREAPHVVLERHGYGVTSVAVGRVGGRDVVVSGSLDRTVRVWDPGTGRPLAVLEGHAAQVFSVAVGRVGGRDVVVSGSFDRTVRVWDPGTGRRLAVLEGVTRAVSSVAVGRVGGRDVVVSGSDDGTVRVWDPGAGRPAAVLEGHTREVTSVAVGSVGGRDAVVSGSDDGTVRVWDPGAGRPAAVLEGHTREVTSVAVGSVGGRDVVVSGSFDRTVRVWDPGTGRRLAVLEGVTGAVFSVAVGRVGGRDVVVSSAPDGAVRVWDPGAGGPAAVLESHGGVTSVAVGSIRGREVVVSGSDDGTVRVWDPGAGWPAAVLEGHTGAVFSVAVGSVGGRDVVVSGSSDRTVRLWDPATGAPADVLEDHGYDVTSVAVGSVGGRDVVVSGSSDRTVRLWDPATGAPAAVLEGHAYWVTSVAVGSIRGREVVVSGSRDGTVRVWDPRAGAPAAVLEGHGYDVTSVAVGSVGGRDAVVSGGRDGAVRVWDPGAGAPAAALEGHAGPVSSVAVGRVGGRDVVVSGSDDETVRVWDPATGAPAAVLALGASVSGVALGPGGALAVAAGRDVIALSLSPSLGLAPAS